jgi:hypothetical protein
VLLGVLELAMEKAPIAAKKTTEAAATRAFRN